MHNDTYESCSETYVTLRIYTENINSEKLTQYLGFEPTESQNANDQIKLNSWFLSTEKEIKSKNCRSHLDYLLEKLLPKKDKIKSLN